MAPRALVSMLLAACMALGCATRPIAAADNRVAPGFRSPVPGSLVVLLPARKGLSDVAAGEDIVLRQLHAQLLQAGFKVVGLEPDNYELIWSQEVAAVGGVYDGTSGALKADAYSRALGALTRRVAEQTHCALVISPRLAMRTATLSGSSASWDGQVRMQPVTRRFGMDVRFDGTTLGLSVELLALEGDGGFGFQTFGGTTLPFRTDLASTRNEIRPDLFVSEDETADGVRIALGPLLGH